MGKDPATVHASNARAIKYREKRAMSISSTSLSLEKESES